MPQVLQDILDTPVFRQALDIWESGGWAMIALAVDALILFVLGANVWIGLKSRGFSSVSEKRWRNWVTDPAARRGPIGELIDFVTRAPTIDEVGHRFAELHIQEVEPFGRDLRFMRRAVSAAPLLGLLGTVTGMLSTFAGLATGGGGDQTMDLVAGGISEALITTETGLVIAVPGLFLHFHLSRQRDRYRTFLAHLQSHITQTMYRATHPLPAALGGQGGR